MKLCWNVPWTDDEDYLLKYWSCISAISEGNIFINENLLESSDLIDSIRAQCFNEDNRLMKFPPNFKISKLIYQGNSYQVCLILNNCKSQCEFEIMMSYYWKTFSSFELIHYDTDNSTAYIVEELPHKRLIDVIEEFTIDDLESFIYQITEHFNQLIEEDNMSLLDEERIFVLRADNLFIDELGKIFVSKLILHEPGLPFILKNQIAVPSFHLHPVLISEHKDDNMDNIFCRDNKDFLTQFIYSFGWFIWILVEGSGSKCPDVSEHDVDRWLLALQLGRFPEYPPYLRCVMSKCWNVPVTGREESFLKYWKDISKTIKSNIWMKHQSKRANPHLINLTRLQNTPDNSHNVLLRFSETHKILPLHFENAEYQATVIQSQQNEQHYQQLKKEVYKSMRDRFDITVYESKSESILYVIEKLPHKRLIDCLEELNLDTIISVIEKVARDHGEEIKHLFNFRPDCLFIDGKGNVFINRFISNNINLPFLLKDKTPVKPFHILPVNTNTEDQSVKFGRNKNASKFIYSFGWFVWMMIEGSGSRSPRTKRDGDINNYLQILQSGKHPPNYPRYLKDVMIMCWNADNSQTNDIYQDFGQYFLMAKRRNQTVDIWNRIREIILDEPDYTH